MVACQQECIQMKTFPIVASDVADAEIEGRAVEFNTSASGKRTRLSESVSNLALPMSDSQLIEYQDLC